MVAPGGSEGPRPTFSLTSRLAGLVLLLVLGVLSLATFLPYWLLTRQLSWEDAASLGQKVENVRQALAEYPAEPDRLEAEVLRELGSRGFRQFYVRVLEPGGETLLASRGIDSILPARTFLPAADSADSRTVSAGGRTFVWTTREVTAGRPRTVTREVQVAMDVTPERELAGRYLRLSLGVFAASLLVSLLGAIGVARWGLRPLGRITAMAERIGPHHLDERLGRVGWPSELTELARVFDGMLDRLNESFGRLSRFSADLAHELRTPLSNLTTEMEVALARPRSTDRYRDVIGSALEECGRLSDLVETLLFLARAESGRAALRPERVDIGEEAGSVVELYRPLAEQRGVALTCDGSVAAQADPTLLRRALSNLLSNAIEHTPPGGEVAVNAREAADGVEIAVRDTGTGIAGEDLPRVFDRFYRAEEDRASGRRGTGLGLSLVRSIARLHGGDATICSQPGDGTTVVVSLPSSPPAVPGEAGPLGTAASDS